MHHTTFYTFPQDECSLNFWCILILLNFHYSAITLFHKKFNDLLAAADTLKNYFREVYTGLQDPTTTLAWS